MLQLKDNVFHWYIKKDFFPSIRSKTTFNNCYIVSCLPNVFLTKSIKICFDWIQSQVCSRLTPPDLHTSTDLHYCTCCYDMSAYLSENNKYTRLNLNRGLEVGDNERVGLGIRGSVYFPFLELVNNGEMVIYLPPSKIQPIGSLLYEYMKQKDKIW